MPAVKIVLKLLCQNVDSGHQCQVNLRRSIYEIDSEIEEIKLPLQAIVKLKRIHQPQDLQSSSMLPMHQQAQLSLPVMSKVALMGEREAYGYDGRGSRRFDDDGRRSTTIRVRKSSVKDGGVKKSRSQEELKEIKAMLLEVKEKLMAKGSASGSLVDEEPPVVEKDKWFTNSVVRRLSEGLKEINATEKTNCPFVQYVLAKEDAPEGNIDTSLPLSSIIGSYSLAYKHGTPTESAGRADRRSTAVAREHILSSESEYPKSTREDTDTSTIRMGILSNESDAKYSLQACPEHRAYSIEPCPNDGSCTTKEEEE